MKYYAQINQGVVVNVAKVDPENVPEHMADWVEVSEIGVGWTYDGETFSPPPDQTAEEIAALVEKEVAALFDASTRRDRALAEMMWQIAKASKTGNWSWFDAANGGAGVSSKADFREVFKEIIAEM